MASPARRLALRYHRRILAVGGVATVMLLVIGAPFYNDRIEDDLERRVPAELADAGFTGITATFSGQDGTLRCAGPLDDPERAASAAYDVWGVRAIELDRSCRVNRAPTVETTVTVAVTDSSGGSTQTDASDDVPDGAPATSSTLVAPDFDSVADVIDTSPQLSLLSVLVQEAGLADLVAADASQPITMFAPTDDAFDALDADAFAKLRADPELLRTVLSHHVVEGALMTNALVDGPLTALDGTALDLVSAAAGLSVSGAEIVVADVTALNGVVHVVDRVIVPAGADLSGPGPAASTDVVLEGSTITLSGVVASEVERAALLRAATGAQPTIQVDDRLTVDPDRGLDAVNAASLAQLIAVMPGNLTLGSCGFDGTGLYVSGTFSDESARDAVQAAADSVGATADLQPPADATGDDAAALETTLNAYVAANPILFEQGSSVLTDSSSAVLDRLALEAQQLAGVAITVEGHTDSDGDPDENRILSTYRALVVRQALIDRGVAEASITAVGYGSERPVLVDGVEDKSASRRVEFRVAVTE